MGTAPLTVRFTDQSTNSPTSWKWDYRKTDGSWSVFGSGSQNPTNIFAAGSYDIRLTATNTAGDSISSKTGYIVVAAPVPPTATFTSNIQSGTAPLTIQFTDKSSGTAPLSYAWDFTNDGETESTIKSPSFTYATPGMYSVKLTVTNIARYKQHDKNKLHHCRSPGSPDCGIHFQYPERYCSSDNPIHGQIERYRSVKLRMGLHE